MYEEGLSSEIMLNIILKFKLRVMWLICTLIVSALPNTDCFDSAPNMHTILHWQIMFTSCFYVSSLFVRLASFKVSENCHSELEDLPPELPAQLWDT